MNPFLRHDLPTLGGQNIAVSFADQKLQASERPEVISGTRHYRVGEIRRWLRGEWSAKGVQQ